MDNLKARGQVAEVNGLPPQKSIDLTSYSGATIPADWEIVGVTGDILMVEFADSLDADGELVNRGGIIVNNNINKNVWRVGKIIHSGPGASAQAQPGAHVMFPYDRGIPMTKFEGHNYIFLNEQRIFAFVKPASSKSIKS